MQHPRRILLAAAIALAAAPILHAREANEIVIGTSAGPYADQVKHGIKPILERQGYKVKVVEFSGYIQPNFALAEGSLDANVFQHSVYLNKFAADHKLALSELVSIPTAPIAIYSRRHRSPDTARPGTTAALPNDPTNQARALVMLERLGWIKLRPSTDPVKASERDIAANPRGIKLLPLEAAQLPRALQDADYAFINGNYALASADRSREFLAWTVQHCPGYAKTDYQLALLARNSAKAR